MTADQLTEREREVLALMAEGLTNRQIAGRLTLEQSTIRWYARQIYTRLGAENRQEAVARALELGLIVTAEQDTRPPHNLPVPTTPFVGRLRELALLDELLADRAVRLITITGPGGIGKTRLALAAAERQLQPRLQAAGRLTYPYPDGIWFFSLVALDSAPQLTSTFAETLKLQFETASGRAPLAQLLDYLREKRALLVLDNFEHLLDKAEILAEIAAAAAGVQLLVTSQERLQLPGEQLFSLDGLDVPAEGAETLAALEGYASVRLFLNTARRVQPDLALRDEDAGLVARICRAAGGMPLGVELAASWASVLPLREIAREIEGSLALLAADRRGVPARHRSMQAALDASWLRLAPAQQAAFRQLCLFRGGFTRPAAFQITGATLPVLVTLINKSWLTYDPAGDRYHIHELLRQYGLQKLAEDPDLEQETRDRHSAYFAARLQERAADFTSGRQKEWVSEMQAELPNVKQAWEWAIQAGDAGKVGQSVESLARFYDWMGRLADGESTMAAAAERLAGLAQGKPFPAEWSRIWARTLIWQSRFANDPQRTLLLLGEAQALIERLPAGELDLREDRAFLLTNLGWVIHKRDRLAASEFFAQALELCRDLDDRAGMAECLLGLGTADWARSHLDQAAPRLEASLAIRRELGDRRGMAKALDILALVRKHQGRPEEAERLHRQVVESYRLLGSRLDEMIATANLAQTLADAGKYQEMLELARRAAAMASELGGGDEGHSQLTVARALQHLGHYEEAQALLLEGAKAAREAGFLQHLGFALGWMGETTLIAGDYGQAERCFTDSEAIFAELQQNVLAIPLAWLSNVYRLQGDLGRAGRQLGRALQLALDRGSGISLRHCLPVAALLAADRGDLERAAELHALGQTFASIANSRWFYDVAGRELDEIVARLPAEVAEAATKRGRNLDLWQTAEALAAGFNQG